MTPERREREVPLPDGHRPWTALAARDLHFAVPAVGPLLGAFRRYFRLDIDGFEHLDDPRPVLIVANHSGGGWSPDAVAFILEYLARYGPERPLYFLAHRALMSLPVLGPALERCGVLPASPAAARAAFDRGASVVVFPGGEADLHRPWSARNEIRLGGRKGFLRLARDAEVPIVPVVAAGGQSTYLPITDGRELARRSGLQRLTGIKVLPVAAGLPFGLTVGNLFGWIPLPAHLRIRVLTPLTPEDLADDLDDAYQQVHDAMQVALDDLAAT